MSTRPDVKKDLLTYLLMQVKNKQLDVDRAKAFIKAIGDDESSHSDPIAVVGIACRFPDAPDKEQFWRNLVDGRESIGEFPPMRVDDLRRVDNGSAPLRKGGYLDRIDLFDPEYFGIPPKAATQLDPYHRNMMEVLVETMEDAGYSKGDLHGSTTGIFVGNDHTHRMMKSYLPFLSDVDFSAISGSWSGILASRLSYHLNFRGPASVIDTGCSSGLVALDAAIKAIRHGDCDTAFVGAINLLLAPFGLGNETESGDYQVRAFDATANGTVWSEGVAAVYIKPLARAVADRDHIYGVVLGTAINSDGRSNGLTAPNAQAQKNLLTKAWEQARIAPESVSYIEAHGTGTSLGDPIEIKGLTGAFSAATNKRQFCALGSVKSNIGHTVGAAGLASLIKTLLALENKAIPPSINFDVPNDLFDLAQSPVYVNDRLAEWDGGPTPRRAGVSSFSLSGTNCHVVLEEAPAHTRGAESDDVHVYPISAQNSDLLASTAAAHLAFLDRHPEYRLDDVCFTMQVGREAQPARAVILCDGRTGLRAGLAQLAQPITDHVESICDGRTVVLRADPTKPSAADNAPPDPGETVPDSAGADRRIDLPGRFRHLTDAVVGYLEGRPKPFADLVPDPHVRRVPLPAQLFDHVRVWDEDARPATAVASAEEDSGVGTAAWIRDALAKASARENAADRRPARAVVAGVWSDVLGYPTINGTDDFFALGGDSVGSLKITQALNAAFDLDIPASTLLEKPTFAEFADTVINDFGLTDERVHTQVSSPGRRSTVSEPLEEYELPLTAAQRSMFFASRLDDASVAYNISGLAIRHGAHDLDGLEAALRALVRRHDSLRSTFHLVHGEPFQRVRTDIPVSIEHRRLGRLAEGQTHETRVKEEMADFVRPFRLDEAPLFRVGYFEFDDGMTCLAIDIHHIITDGTSMGILFRDLGAISEGVDLPPLQRSYRSGIRALLERQNEIDMAPHRNYWVAQFDDEIPVLQLTYDWLRPDVVTGSGATLFTLLDPATLDSAKRYARAKGVTLYTVLLGVFHQLLARMSGQGDIVIGAPVMGRPDLTYQDLVGMFVNTVPIRVGSTPTTTVGEFMAGLKSAVVAAFEHQAYPVESLVDELDPPRHPGRRPLFDVCFVHQNTDMGLDREDEQVIAFDDGSAKYDITLSTREVADGLHMEWEYSTALFREATIELYAQRYTELLRSVVVADDADPLHSLSMIPESERDLIRRFAESPAEPVESAGVVALFEQQVAADPQATALVMGDDSLTYAELNTQANRVAHGLISHGVAAGSPVALLMDRSFDLIVAILGVLKAGCHYLPLNVEFPAERLQLMIGDARVLIADAARREQADALHRDELLITDVEACMARTARSHDPGLRSSSEDEIYIMYTSGTTGVPKGSLIRQKSVQRVVRQSNFYAAGPTDVFLMMSDYAFDGSVYDMFAALTNGASLVIVDKATVLDLDRLADAIQRHGVTSFFITAAMFNTLIDLAPEALSSIRRMIFGGEMASPGHVGRAFELLGPGRLANGYGPTESTVFAAVHTFDQWDARDAIPIGRPINNTSLWVLDDQLELQPIGAPGELCIGGDGLTDGYLDQPELTADRFVYSPAVPGQRLYRTGDLVTFKSNGLLYYTGRIDQQVKLRGYRIELGEIMHVAMEEPYVRWAHAAVHDSPEAGRNLCLWVTYDGGNDERHEAALRSALQRRLPSYMVPSFVVATAHVPFTRNGKLDVEALPKPVISGATSSMQPATDGQRQIAEAWSRVLGTTVEDIDANFFALGGDSIKAIQIVAKLKEYGIAVRVTDLLENQTVRLLDEMLADSSRIRADLPIYDQSPVTGPVTAGPIQQAFLADSDNRGRVFNQSLLVTLDEPVPPERVTAAVRRLVRQHDMLRMQVDDGGMQIRPVDAERLVHSEPAPDSLSAAELPQYVRSLQTRVDLAGGPVVALATGLEHGRQFAVAIHHLAVDVVSWTVLVDDLITCLADADADLPPRTMSFPSWTADLKRYAESGGFRPQLGYWTDVARSAQGAGDLFPERDVRMADTTAQVIHFAETDASALFDSTREQYGLDPGQTLLAVIARALAGCRGADQVLFTLEGHGRERFADDHDVSRTVGWFTSTFPHVIEVGDSAVSTVETVRRSFQRLPDKGFGFGPLLHLDSGLGDDGQVLAGIRPQVSFNYLGEQDSQADGVGLEHLSSEVTVDAEYLSSHVLDIIASRRNGAVLIDLRYPRVWHDNGVADELAEAISRSFREVAAAVAERDHSTVRTSPSIRQAVVDDILVDLMGGS